MRAIAIFLITLIIFTMDYSYNSGDKNSWYITNNLKNNDIFQRKVIIVDQEGNGDFINIQDAINNSNNGDIIHIYYGKYYENLIINKSIIIEGIGNPSIFRGINPNYFIFIESGNISLKNVSLENLGSETNKININESFLSFHSIDFIGKFAINTWKRLNNIYINKCNFYKGPSIIKLDCSLINISNCFFNNTMIVLGQGYETLQENNITIFNNFFNYGSGPTIDIYYVNFIFIKNNTFKGCNTAIKCYHYSTKFYIINNNFTDCHETVMLGSTSGQIDYVTLNIEISNNKFYNCYHITIVESINILFYNNTILNNIYSGLTLINCINVNIFNNNFTRNNVGLGVEDTDKITIYKNDFYENIKGVSFENTNNLLIYKNYFIYNTVQATDTNIDYWNNQYPIGGNYWSDYIGKDIKKGPNKDQTGSDGFGDETYYLGNIRDSYPLFFDYIKPIANAGSDVQIDQWSNYHFDSSKSNDDQMIDKVTWEFNYSGTNQIFSDKEFDFKFDLSGFYPIKLTVYDFPGNSDTATFNITVKDLSPPIPLVQGDIVIKQGETVFFNASSSTDNSGIVNSTWAFQYGGEYVQLYGMTTRFKFYVPGYYSVTLLLIDTAENFASIKFNVTVIDTESPVALAGDDVEIENGDSVLFDASLSTDNGILTGFNWSFDHDGQRVYLEGKVTSFDFVKPGHYQVTLNVSDEFGNHDTDSIKVTVIDTHPPEAVIKGTLVQNPGGTIRLNGLSSTDNGRVIRYLWEFSDNGPLSVVGPYLNHTFERKGRHNVTLTVYDEWNMSGAVTVIVDVIDQQRPTASAGADVSIPAGTVYTFNGSGSTDDGIIVSYRWIFEYDGEEVRLEGETVQFRFEKGGTYNVLLTVTDQTGNWGEDGSVLTVIDKGVLKGTVIDKKGSPIKGAKVTVKASDGKDYVGISSDNGSFIVDVFMGGATYEITKAGYRSVSGAVTIRPMETTVLDSTGATLEPSSRSGNSPLLFIIAGIVVGLLIGGSVLFFILRRKKEGTEGAASDTSNGTEPSDGPEGPKIEEDGNVEGPVEGEPLVEEMFKAPKEEEIPIEVAGQLTEEMDEFFKEVESETGEVKQQ